MPREATQPLLIQELAPQYLLGLAADSTLKISCFWTF